MKSKILKRIMLFLIGIITLSMLGCTNMDGDDEVNVKGYYRKDGTYVKPHTRTKPDGIKTNNKSYKR